MKNLFMAIVVMVFATPSFAQTGTVTVNVLGIENNKGVVRIGLYHNKESFPIYEKAMFKDVSEKANTTGVSYTFSKILEGTYAVAVWHDENEDKTLNKNFLGAPKENYGFSKNIFGTFGPPDFEEVSFEVKNGKMVKLTIILE